MKVFSLYRQFFDFLARIVSHPTQPSENWPLYFDHYYQPNKEFLDVYFSHMPLVDHSALEGRVNAIKPADYSWLKTLCTLHPPETIIDEVYEKCIRAVPPPRELEVYLLIGFFSPEGFVLDYQGKPVMGFGLERFRDFRSFQVIFAHEYVHFLLRSAKADVWDRSNIRDLMISEGLATLFPSLILPGLPLSDYFLFRRERLNWCQANEVRLKEIFCSKRFSPQEMMDLYFKGSPEMDLPARAPKYLGYQAVVRYLGQHPETTLAMLLLDENLALSIEI